MGFSHSFTDFRGGGLDFSQISQIFLRRLSVFYAVAACESIQPERLNAEGDSPSALSRGLSEAQPLEHRQPQRKASEGRECYSFNRDFSLNISSSFIAIWGNVATLSLILSGVG